MSGIRATKGQITHANGQNSASRVKGQSVGGLARLGPDTRHVSSLRGAPFVIKVPSSRFYINGGVSPPALRAMNERATLSEMSRLNGA